MAKNVHFVLVHGTWAHGFWRALFWRWIPKRFLPRAVKWPLLCQKLEQSAGTIHSFVWSGRNDHRARMQAGLALRKRLKDIASDDERIYVLAHSHGGNVALYAIDDPDLEERIEGIVFMATPFLHFRPQRLELGLIHATLQILAASTFVIPMFVFLIYAPDFWNVSEWSKPIVFGAFGLSLVLGYILSKFLSIIFENWHPESQARQQSKKFQPQPPGEQMEVLVVRNIGDEATIALVGGSLVEWLLAGIWRASFLATVVPLAMMAEWFLNRLKHGNWKLVIAILVATVAAVLILAPSIFWGILIASYFFIVVLGALHILLGLIILILNFTRFGWYGFWSTALVRVSTEATPTGRWPAELFPSDDVAFAHSEAYRDPKIVLQITDWLKAKLANESR